MKLFLALVISALVFCGYSAASHAMGGQDCSSAVQAQSHECNHAGAASDDDHAAKHEKSGGKCMDCSHCCASSPAIVQAKSFSFSMTGTVFAPEPSRTQAQGRIFSLLRPPRILA